MKIFSTWRIEPTKILTRRELACVLNDLHQQARRSQHAHQNLIILRLACCCGLRASEIAGLRAGDVITGVARPHLRIRAETAKGGRARVVPLWWDAGTLADLEAWKEHLRSAEHFPSAASHERAAKKQDAPFVGCQKPGQSKDPSVATPSAAAS